jgi:hypothetical protein
MDVFKNALLKIPAWSDWFMRGETHCYVVSIGRKWVHVKGIRSDKKWRVDKELINGRDYIVKGECHSIAIGQ